MNCTQTPAALAELLTARKIPSLNDGEMAELLQYLFSRAKRTVRIEVAEIAFRLAPTDPRAKDVFLACAMPLAETAASKKAYRLFFHPSDWQLELMYDGAVEAALNVFHSRYDIRPGLETFRRYFLRALSSGTTRRFFMRTENQHIVPVEDLGRVSAPSKPFRNNIEQDVITRELLDKVINYPHLPLFVSKTLKCIAALGPDIALKEHAFTKSGDPDKWKRDRGGTPILNPIPIAKARGVTRLAVHFQLWKARVVLRQVFNADGKLFMSH
jgi:hypothetical protein